MFRARKFSPISPALDAARRVGLPPVPPDVPSSTRLAGAADRSSIQARTFAAAALVAALVVPAALPAVECERVYAIGDLHGAYDPLVEMLQQLELVDEELRWVATTSCLVQLGDIVHRGTRTREILDLLMRLETEAGGRLTVLLGNHEVLSLLGDMTYVSAGEIEAFADEERPETRQTAFMEFQRTRITVGLEPQAARELFDQKVPPGALALQRAFSPTGHYGRWLLDRPTLVRIGDSLFVHGGLTVTDARRGIDVLNEQMVREIVSYHELREILVRGHWISPITPFSLTFAAVQAQNERRNSPISVQLVHAARRMIAFLETLPLRETGPIWNRDLSNAEEADLEFRVNGVLDTLRVSRIVVAHTPNLDGRIHSRFDGRVFTIDTGAGPSYGGRISALEVLPDGRVNAVYLDGSEPLVQVAFRDREIARFLGAGRIVESEEIADGTVRPQRVVLELDGRRMRAAYKHVETGTIGEVDFDANPPRFQTPRRFGYERASFLLDRHLELDMLPVVVLRRFDGAEGVLIEWVEGAIDERERLARGLEPEDPGLLRRQQSVMGVFDLLIHNTDRDGTNQLITLDDWKLHLIDHSRAFGASKKLLKSELDEPLRLPRSLYDRLSGLKEAPLRELFGDLLTRAQVRALLSRRDKIVQRIDRDRRAYGDDRVFGTATDLN